MKWTTELMYFNGFASFDNVAGGTETNPNRKQIWIALSSLIPYQSELNAKKKRNNKTRLTIINRNEHNFHKIINRKKRINHNTTHYIKLFHMIHFIKLWLFYAMSIKKNAWNFSISFGFSKIKKKCKTGEQIKIINKFSSNFSSLWWYFVYYF